MSHRENIHCILHLVTLKVIQAKEKKIIFLEETEDIGCLQEGEVEGWRTVPYPLLILKEVNVLSVQREDINKMKE